MFLKTQDKTQIFLNLNNKNDIKNVKSINHPINRYKHETNKMNIDLSYEMERWKMSVMNRLSYTKYIRHDSHE